MTYRQLVAAKPKIPCTPGWCLNYVQRVFGVGWSGPNATDAWENRLTQKHANDNFPDGVAVPVWFAFEGVPEGHVAVRWGDGSYYSSSHPTNTTPIHHPNLQHLLSYYGGKLTLRGWSEDLGGVELIEETGGNVQEGTINDNDDIAELWRFGFFREPTAQELKDYQVLIGKYWNDAIKYLRQSEAGQQVKRDYLSIPSLASKVAESAASKQTTREDAIKYINDNLK